MNDFDKAILGELKPPGGDLGASKLFSAANYLSLPVQLHHLDWNGHSDKIWDVPAGGGLFDPSCAVVDLAEYCVGDCFVWIEPTTGSLLYAQSISQDLFDGTGAYAEAESAQQLALTYDDYRKPNDIGPIPDSTSNRPIPPSTAAVCVGFGMINSNSAIASDQPGTGQVVHTQRWRLQGQSVSLAPNETRQISYTVSQGMQKTTSAQASVAASLGLGANIGWGPIGASLSASLDASASVSVEANLSEESTVYVSEQMQNSGDKSLEIMRWQLVEEFVFVDMGGRLLASIQNALNPVITRAYDA